VFRLQVLWRYNSDMKNLLLILMFALFFTGCAKTPSDVVKTPEPLEEIQPYHEEEKTAGSLWSNDATSIFADHKAKKIGDIIGVTIAEKASATKEATTSTGRTSSYKAGITNLFGLEKSGDIAHTNMDLANLVNTNFTNSFDGNGKTARKGDLTAQLSVQVIDLYPNGNLKIRGGKEVMVNNEVQIIYITGIVRPVDITAANTIDSNKILNARISYTGKGVLSDKQEAGWLTRTLDNIWPF
jgi:flagellar L-ring protein FlgH